MQRGGALLSSMLRRESGQAGTQFRLHESIIGAIDLVLFRHRVSLSRGTCWVLSGAGNHEPRRAKELMCSKLRHHRTFRGHSSAVYVLAIDHESRYVLSGSDDAVVKIWSLSTGVLLNSCRGHEVRGRIVNLAFIVLEFRCALYMTCAIAAFRERSRMSRLAATRRWQPARQLTP